MGKNGPRIKQEESKGIQTKMPFFKEKFILANIVEQRKIPIRQQKSKKILSFDKVKSK